MPSIFSRIIAGSIPGAFVHRDAEWVAILDRFPVAPGHLLLIPVHEAALLPELPATTLAGLGPLISRASACLRRALHCDAVTVLVRDGAAAGQEVPHVHVHCIPRRQGEAAHGFKPGSYGPDAGAVDQAIAALAARLQEAW